jgi:hypothetical protein
MKIFKDFATDKENGTSLCFFIQEKYQVGIQIHEADGKYSLWWTDFVANEYTETYDSLSVAMAGLAVLLACAESDWDRFFKHTNEDFSVLAQDFINSAC